MSSRIGDALVKTNLLTPEQLEQALEAQKSSGESLLSTLVQLGFTSEQDYLTNVSKHFSSPIIELDSVTIDQTTISLIPADLARKHCFVPIVQEKSTLKIAMSDPSNLVAINELKFFTGLELKVHLATESAIKQCYEKHYEQDVSYDNLLDDFESQEDVEVVDFTEDIDVGALEQATEDAPVVKLVNAILSDAIKKGASDIHLEPYEKSFRVRFRIDGMLYEIMSPPQKLKNAMTSRLKIMADLDISERRLPQDGRIKLKLGRDREMDFRVNTLPTLFGEKVVLRLLDKSNLQLDMTKLGFFQDQLLNFQECIAKPYGMVLVTGPTGSGKTTTLYSALAALNKTVTNISTAEDPVEFNLAGINQAQMHDEIGYNFASALRAFLRQDPDVIMVGEIRDLETAEIAIKASLTGHLVLSTLHTNDAPSTIGRLLNMGVEPFLVGSSINAIVAQRLARRICSECSEDAPTPEADALTKIGFSTDEIAQLQLKKGKGCEKCSNTGYKGRVALYEVLVMTEALKDAVIQGMPSQEIGELAEREGMLTLRASALKRVKEGVTTVEELLRTTTGD